MKKKLIIIGAGNVGGFVSYNIDEFNTEYEVIGFLDDDRDKIGKKLYEREVLGPIQDIRNFIGMNISVVIGIANPIIKRGIAKELLPLKFEFPSFISKNVWLSKKVSLGKGVILYPGVSINYDTIVDDFVIINMNCAIGHNCSISTYSTLAPGVNLAGFTQIGEAVDVGIGVSTKQQVKIGKNAIIGGQTMLINDVSESTKIAGVPGRII